MSEPKPTYKTNAPSNGRFDGLNTARFRFSALDMLKQAKGLPTPEGYVVITKDFTEFLQDELSRLYEIEDALKDHASELAIGAVLGTTIPDLMRLCHIEVEEPTHE